jgi:hypothetical protein
MQQVTFIVHRAEEGGYWAEAEGLSISTQGEILDELDWMIRDAVSGYFFDQPEAMPQEIRSR